MTCLTIVFVTAIVAATFVALIMAIVQAARHWED
jgi:type III secretory pathway component EscS